MKTVPEYIKQLLAEKSFNEWTDAEKKEISSFLTFEELSNWDKNKALIQSALQSEKPRTSEAEKEKLLELVRRRGGKSGFLAGRTAFLKYAASIVLSLALGYFAALKSPQKAENLDADALLDTVFIEKHDTVLVAAKYETIVHEKPTQTAPVKMMQSKQSVNRKPKKKEENWVEKVYGPIRMKQMILEESGVTMNDEVEMKKLMVQASPL